MTEAQIDKFISELKQSLAQTPEGGAEPVIPVSRVLNMMKGQRHTYVCNIQELFFGLIQELASTVSRDMNPEEADGLLKATDIAWALWDKFCRKHGI